MLSVTGFGICSRKLRDIFENLVEEAVKFLYLLIFNEEFDDHYALPIFLRIQRSKVQLPLQSILTLLSNANRSPMLPRFFTTN